jgi:hypothetical protein
MTRYTTKSWLDYDWLVKEPIKQETPIVPEHIATPTGIFSSSGKMIYREPRPIGFMRDEEW